MAGIYRTGTEGPDQLLGSHEADTIYGGGGDDLVSGVFGDDMTMTADGRYGLAIPILAAADTGRDLLHGDAGNDTIYGGAGADYLQGGAGNDTLVGGKGPDILIGDSGANVGPGRIEDAGAAGADVFRLQDWRDSAAERYGGIDTIADFWPGVDKIDVSAMEKGAPTGFRFLGAGGYDGAWPGLTANYRWDENGTTVLNFYHATTPGNVLPHGYVDPYWGPKGPPSFSPTGTVVLQGHLTLSASDFVWDAPPDSPPTAGRRAGNTGADHLGGRVPSPGGAPLRHGAGPRAGQGRPRVLAERLGPRLRAR